MQRKIVYDRKNPTAPGYVDVSDRNMGRTISYQVDNNGRMTSLSTQQQKDTYDALRVSHDKLQSKVASMPGSSKKIPVKVFEDAPVQEI